MDKELPAAQKQVPSTQKQLAPPGYRKISDDLWQYHNWGGAFCTWVIALCMAPVFFLMSVFYPIGAVLVGILFFIWPVLATMSYFDMRNVCRYMTWSSENTSSVKAYVKAKALKTYPPLTRIYITHDQTEYCCLPAAWSNYETMEKQNGPMDVHFLPNTDEPLFAVTNDLRIWFRTTMVDEEIDLSAVPKKRELSAKEFEELSADFKTKKSISLEGS